MPGGPTPLAPFPSILFILPFVFPLGACADSPGHVGLRDFFEGQIAFDRPVFFAQVPGKENHYLVLEQHEGKASVAVFDQGKGSKRLFVQVQVARANEMGLLGFAFHPRFAENRKYYLHYNPDLRTSLIEERVADSSLISDAGGRPREILRIRQPYANHNGGTIAFGPKDGFLYLGFGDGGSGGDPENRAQNPMNLLGKFLRIDVDRPAPGKGYSVPIDNPFVGKSGYRPEIWAMGVRNPWKWAFHPKTGELWMGDVGQGTGEWAGYEEISRPHS
jgi:glucose/arabinose dehydrogenase